MKKINKRTFISDIGTLIQGLYGADYLTHKYKKYGMKSLLVLEGVFRPDKSYLGEYVAKVLNINKDIYENKKVLDLGCGTGILGLVCALSGAKSVSFSDINQIAVKNSQINSLLLGLKNAEFYCGSLFENIPKKQKFDLIIFNSPTISGKAKNEIEMAFIREDKVMLDFFRTYHNYLNEGGKVLIPGSTRFKEKNSPENLIEMFKLKSKILASKKDGEYTKYVICVNGR